MLNLLFTPEKEFREFTDQDTYRVSETAPDIFPAGLRQEFYKLLIGLPEDEENELRKWELLERTLVEEQGPWIYRLDPRITDALRELTPERIEELSMSLSNLEIARVKGFDWFGSRKMIERMQKTALKTASEGLYLLVAR